jgi:fatty acid kinase fatty acid binding subunit
VLEGAVGRVAIITDSSADLLPEQIAAHDLTVVPLFVRFGDREYRVGVDLTTEAFWAELQKPGAPFPSTAAPSPGTFQETFEAAFAGGAEAVVAVLIGAKISATFSAAKLAAEALPGREIHLVDSRSTSMSTGFAAILAAEMAAAGVPAAEIATRVRDRLPDLDLYVAIDTLEYLRRGGRLSPARAAIGSVLSVKPIITVRDGLVDMAEKPRTRAKARERVIELISQAPVERLAVIHTPTSPPDEVAAFRDAVLARIPGGVDPAFVSTGLLGATTGPHLGPGLLGAAFLRAR